MYDLGPDGALVFDLGLDDLLDEDDEDAEAGRGAGRKRSASAMEDDDVPLEMGRRDDRDSSHFSNNSFGGGGDLDLLDQDGNAKVGPQVDLDLDGDMGGFGDDYDWGGGDQPNQDRERSSSFLLPERATWRDN